MVTLHVNGEPRRFGADVTVFELLAELEIDAPAIAVEVNRSIVPKSAHETHRLKDGDHVEIVTFVGGG